ncbi:Ribosome-binding factor A [Alloiococcus otitis]|uniref:Ribosome-binding factor A n=1 Tax=Alloiococcus otitis ATCC 51267 TaxID=883081 RepID=K9EAM0_9LACT|nr:30S ribosome-binding factor RbfA [Alloiococcus otitis]EKU94284.1 ribosome-binding factor A [Alloiococcus otitis ATCC 51267]SUU81082.1 Ribosome-binding factor A [Alloiococcus otitis]
MPSHRQGRVAQEIKREATDILRNEVRDPRVDGVTITDAEVTADLQHAKIFYSTLSDDDQVKTETQEGLDKASGLVRSEIGNRIKLFKTPEIRFVRDESLEYGNRIDQIINELHQEDSN